MYMWVIKKRGRNSALGRQWWWRRHRRWRCELPGAARRPLAPHVVIIRLRSCTEALRFDIVIFDCIIRKLYVTFVYLQLTNLWCREIALNMILSFIPVLAVEAIRSVYFLIAFDFVLDFETWWLLFLVNCTSCLMLKEVTGFMLVIILFIKLSLTRI